MIFVHFHNSCTRNCNHNILLIMTGNAHKESCHKLWLLLNGEGIETIKTDGSGEMVVAFTITQINYLVVSLSCNVVLPLSYVCWPAVYICGIKLFWLHYLSCLRHSDESGYGFHKLIYHILVGAYQAKLFSNKTLRNI